MPPPRHRGGGAPCDALSRHLYGRDRLGGDAFLPAGKAHAFGGGGFDADPAGRDAEDFGDAGDHLRTVRADLGALADDGEIEMD